MSIPTTCTTLFTQNIKNNLISAQSALNMTPFPVANPLPDDKYLSETDEWAKDSYNHIIQAYKDMNNLISKKGILVYKLLLLRNMIDRPELQDSFHNNKTLEFLDTITGEFSEL